MKDKYIVLYRNWEGKLAACGKTYSYEEAIAKLKELETGVDILRADFIPASLLSHLGY